MNGLSRHRGTTVFGQAFRVMLANDVHAPGSVDRAIGEDMVLVCPETAGHLYSGFTPVDVKYRPGSRPGLEACVRGAVGGSAPPDGGIAGITEFCARLARRCEEADPDNLKWESMEFGGTEEEIIGRTTDWCTDLARVEVALCQSAGIPARIVQLNDGDPYGGHAIVEAWRDGVWGAADPLKGSVYRNDTGRPLETRELLKEPDFPYKAAAISNYFIWERDRYDYTVSTLKGNGYMRSVLEMSVKGWPGGRRWLYGEDKMNEGG